MAPPELTSRPRKSADNELDKPGRRSLLLKEIMADNQTWQMQAKSTRRQLGKSIKRKHLPPVQQRLIDEERGRAIDLYRQLKVKQQKLS